MAGMGNNQRSDSDYRKSELHWTWKADGDERGYGVGTLLQKFTGHAAHYRFVEGRSLHALRRENEEPGEWIPDLLPANVQAQRSAAGAGGGVEFYGDQARAPSTPRHPRTTVGDEINYFLDYTEHPGSVTGDQEQETNKNHESSNQRHPESFLSKSLPSANEFPHDSVLRPHTQRSLSNPAGEIMAGRGRGRGAGGGGGMLKGATWEYDASIKLESKPTDLFPAHPNLRRPAPMTAKERREIQNYRSLQDQIHRGPLYTQPTKRDPNAPAKTFGEEQFNRQYGTNRKADMDPFHGVETYSMRYAPKQRDLPKLSDQPFNKELFPQELWATLEGTEGQELKNHINRAIQKKAAMMEGTNGNNSSKNENDSSTKPEDTSQKTRLLLEKIHNVAGDEDNEELDEEAQDVEEADDAYDDDDLGDDYNAEGYFDDGDADMEDDGDGGGDDY